MRLALLSDVDVVLETLRQSGQPTGEFLAGYFQGQYHSSWLPADSTVTPR